MKEILLIYFYTLKITNLNSGRFLISSFETVFWGHTLIYQSAQGVF